MKFTDSILKKHKMETEEGHCSFREGEDNNFNLMLNHHIANTVGFLSELYDASMARCESPIEKRFLDSLLFLCIQQTFEIKLQGEYIGVIEGGFPITVRITPQWQFGKYRCDFYIEMERPNFGADITQNTTTRIAVECDGHDFHERTKEQATRDKERDREMTKGGLKVFRYTGSEIFKDPIKCAKEVLDFLEGDKDGNR